MWKKYKGIIILVLIVLLLGGWVIFFEKDMPLNSSDRNVFNLPRTFFTDVNSLELKGENISVKMEKDKEIWFLRTPVDFPADRTEVENIVDQLDLASPERTLRDVSEKLIREHGLSDPRFTVLMKSKEGESAKIFIGNSTTSTSNKVYVRVEGREEIFVISDKVLSYLHNDVDLYRSKKTFTFYATSTNSLQLQGIWNYSVEHSGQQWYLSSPVRAMAGKLDCEGLSSTIYGLEIFKFIDDKPTDFSAYGLSDPKGVIVAQDDEKNESRLLIGSEAEVENKSGEKVKVRYAKLGDRNNVFAILSSEIGKISKDPLTLVDTDFPKFEIDEFKALSFKSTKDSFEIAMDDSDMFFKTADGKGEDVDGSAVSSFFDKIGQMSATEVHLLSEIIEKSKFNDSFVLVVNPSNEGGSNYLRLEIGAYDKSLDSYYILRNDDKVALVVSAEQVKKIVDTTRYNFYERHLKPFVADDVVYVSIMQEGNNVVLSKNGENWLCDSDPKKKVDSDALKEALKKWADFSAFETTAFVPNSKELGSDSPRSTLVISYMKKTDDEKPKKISLSLVFGNDFADGDTKGIYCWMKGEKVAYVVPSTIYQLLAEKYAHLETTPEALPPKPADEGEKKK